MSQLAEGGVGVLLDHVGGWPHVVVDLSALCGRGHRIGRGYATGRGHSGALTALIGHEAAPEEHLLVKWFAKGHLDRNITHSHFFILSHLPFYKCCRHSTGTHIHSFQYHPQTSSSCHSAAAAYCMSCSQMHTVGPSPGSVYVHWLAASAVYYVRLHQ